MTDTVDFERAKEELRRKREAQRVVNAVHRLNVNPDWLLYRAYLERAFGMNLPSFLPPYDTHHAAIRDGQKSILQDFDAKLAAPVNGDANIEKPKRKVRK